MSDRFVDALKKAYRKLGEQEWVYGQIGRKTASGYVLHVPGRPNFVWVTIRIANGGQTVVPARNDASVKVVEKLSVKMKFEAGNYVIHGKSGRQDVGANIPSPDSGVEAHPIDEHTDVLITTPVTGEALVFDGTNWVNDTVLADVAASITAAATDDTIVDADVWGYLTGGVLVKTTWANIKAVIKTYYDSVAATLTNKTLDSTNISSLTAKNPPLAADSVVIVDSAAANIFKSLTFTNLVSYITTLFMDLTTAQTVATGIKTFTPGIVSPSVDGGVVANADLTLQGTTHATRTSSYLILQPNGGLVAVGKAAAGALLDVAGAARYAGTSTIPSADGTGQALELWYYTGGGGPYGLVLAYDRDAAAYKPLRLAGDSIGFEEGATRIMTIDGGFVGILVSVPLTPLQVHVGTNQNLGVVSVSGETTITAYNDTGAANVPLRIASDGTLFVQPTIGNAVQSLQSTSTGDDPIEVVVQARVATTNATTTTLWSTTLAASTTYTITATLVARRTGGAAGAADDSFGQIMTGVFRLTGGVAVLVGWNQYAQHRDQIWTAVFDVTGATVRIRVTGAASNNVTWHATIRLYPVSS